MVCNELFDPRANGFQDRSVLRWHVRITCMAENVIADATREAVLNLDVDRSHI